MERPGGCKKRTAFYDLRCPITLAGLDVTTLVRFEADRRLQLIQRGSPLTGAIMGLYSLWSINSPDAIPYCSTRWRWRWLWGRILSKPARPV